MPRTSKAKAPDQTISAVQANQAEASSSAPTKHAIILGLLARIEGASVDEMAAATGWLPHTTRAMLTGLRKKGHALTSEKLDGVRRYRIAAAGKA